MGANAIIGTCYDNALDVETLDHGAAVAIEPIKPQARGHDNPDGPPQMETANVLGNING